MNESLSRCCWREKWKRDVRDNFLVNLSPNFSRWSLRKRRKTPWGFLSCKGCCKRENIFFFEERKVVPRDCISSTVRKEKYCSQSNDVIVSSSLFRFVLESFVTLDVISYWATEFYTFSLLILLQRNLLCIVMIVTPSFVSHYSASLLLLSRTFCSSWGSFRSKNHRWKCETLNPLCISLFPPWVSPSFSFPPSEWLVCSLFIFISFEYCIPWLYGWTFYIIITNWIWRNEALPPTSPVWQNETSSKREKSKEKESSFKRWKQVYNRKMGRKKMLMQHESMIW